MADNDNQKFIKTFSKIGVLLSNRKKETVKIYFKKPSVRSILLSILCSLLIVDFVFRTMKLFEPTNAGITDNIGYLIAIFIGLSVTFVTFVLILNERIFNFLKVVSCPLIIIGVVLTYFISNPILTIFGGLIIGLGYGALFGCLVNLFLYSFDMSERLMFCLALIFLFFSYSLYTNIFSSLLIQDLIIPAIFCIFTTVMFIISKNLFIITRKSEIIPGYSFILLIGIIFIVCFNQAFIGAIELDIHHVGISDVKSYYSVTYYIGFLLCCIASVLIFLYSKKSLMFFLILYFVAVFGGHQLTIFNEVFDRQVIAWRQCADVAYGFSTSLGYIMILMFIAKILDDKATKFNLFYTVICYICFTFSSMFLRKSILNIDIRVLAIVMMLVNIVTFLVLIILNLLGYLETRSTKNTPIGEIDRNIPKYNIINPEEVLTPKEKIVFDLLLEGLTLRQVAGELGMKYDSVNFHYKNIYRKLQVNSKIELILRYGEQSNKN